MLKRNCYDREDKKYEVSSMRKKLPLLEHISFILHSETLIRALLLETRREANGKSKLQLTWQQIGLQCRPVFPLTPTEVKASLKESK